MSTISTNNSLHSVSEGLVTLGDLRDIEGRHFSCDGGLQGRHAVVVLRGHLAL